MKNSWSAELPKILAQLERQLQGLKQAAGACGGKKHGPDELPRDKDFSTLEKERSKEKGRVWTSAKEEN